MTSAPANALVACLSGGVGGAKLLLGLQQLMPGQAAAIVNTGDDFEHLGLRISPDVDTALYTLSGQSNPELGWGRRDESWHCMEALADLGAETWFRLGDRDLALHLERTRRLNTGESLESIAARVANRWRIATRVLPMTNDRLATQVLTESGYIDFQDYFVRQQCRPRCLGYRFAGAESATVAPAVRELLEQPLRAILIAPSNPYLSIAPILALRDMRELIRRNGAPVIAVSPLIGGEAVKGPTAKIMRELGVDVSPLAIEDFYQGLIDGFVLDERDAHLADRFASPLMLTDTLMQSPEDKQRVARVAIALALQLTQAGSD